MPRGGPREGTPGQSYGNRTDLNAAPDVQTGQTYGKRKAQEDALAIQPGPNQAGAHVVPIDAPTTRPDEPVTAGMPMGPGPGPEVLGPTGDDDVALELRAIYRLFPSEEVRQLIELYDQGY